MKSVDLSLLIQRDIRHLLARIKEGVLGRLGEHILGGTHQHSSIQRCHAQVGDCSCKDVSSQDEAEEGKACA